MTSIISPTDALASLPDSVIASLRSNALHILRSKGVDDESIKVKGFSPRILLKTLQWQGTPITSLIGATYGMDGNIHLTYKHLGGKIPDDVGHYSAMAVDSRDHVRAGYEVLRHPVITPPTELGGDLTVTGKFNFPERYPFLLVFTHGAVKHFGYWFQQTQTTPMLFDQK
jgi:hypothetical protein